MSVTNPASASKPVPTPSPESLPYWEGTAQGELRIQRCLDCTKYYFYPRSGCPNCASTNVTWEKASGRAKLHTYLISHRGMGGFADQIPYAIAVVELEEGPRMMTNIVGIENTPENLVLDMDLEVEFESRGDQAIPVFHPARSAS
jgi:uncharacterized OB-fold protein